MLYCLPEKGLIAAALNAEGLQRCESAGLITEREYSSMRTAVVFVGPSRHAKSSSPTDREVLAGLLVLLGIQASLCKDVDLALPCPVPVNDLPAKIGHIGIGIVELRAWMKQWVVVRFLWCW